MRNPNCRIGFDDRWVTLIMIPVTAFLIPIVFFGIRIGKSPYYDWRMFVTTLITTTVIWLGNRYILIWARVRYPQFPKVKKRLMVQTVIMFIFTILVTNTLGYYLHGFCGLGDALNYPGRDLVDITINSNNAALFCSLTVGAIYESKYLSKKLMDSLEEQEMLKRESLHAQLDALKTQVNPHFLFNNLNTLSAIIPEHPKQAVDFVQQLSKVYRHILDVKDEKSIPLKEELDVLKAYAFLLKTRFGNNVNIDIRVADEKMQSRIVPLSLQLLMENAIKHNVVSADKPLNIDVYAVNGTLVVSNNLQKKNQLSESTGIGLNNIRNRYKLLGDKQVMVAESDSSFTVSIPLIAN
jgi:two-component system, LytTR family, sensor kinase